MSKTFIDKLKRQAKGIARTTGCGHMRALEQLAKEHGYNTWSALLTANKEIKK